MQERLMDVHWKAAVWSQSAYGLLAAVFALKMYWGAPMWLMVEYGLGIFALLWLIHCRRAVLCVCRESDMLVTVEAQSMRDMLLAAIGIHRRMVVPYQAVFGMAHGWRQMLLFNGNGGMTVVPVAWHELSPTDRGYIVKQVELARGLNEDKAEGEDA